jgi:hypothetical protein
MCKDVRENKPASEPERKADTKRRTARNISLNKGGFTFLYTFRPVLFSEDSRFASKSAIAWNASPIGALVLLLAMYFAVYLSILRVGRFLKGCIGFPDQDCLSVSIQDSL